MGRNLKELMYFIALLLFWTRRAHLEKQVKVSCAKSEMLWMIAGMKVRREG